MNGARAVKVAQMKWRACVRAMKVAQMKWRTCVRALKVAQMKWRVCVSRESGSNEMNILTPQSECQNVRLWRISPA